VITVIWSLLLCKNDKVLNDKKSSFLQVIYLSAGYMVHQYSPFIVISTACGDHKLFMDVCTWLEATMRVFFPNMDGRITYMSEHHLLRRISPF
jgi:hypothetical protein